MNTLQLHEPLRRESIGAPLTPDRSRFDLELSNIELAALAKYWESRYAGMAIKCMFLLGAVLVLAVYIFRPMVLRGGR